VKAEKISNRHMSDLAKINIYEVIFSSSHSGIITYDCNGRIIDCNDSSTKIFEMPKDKIIGFHAAKELENTAMRNALLKALKGERGYYQGEHQATMSITRFTSVSGERDNYRYSQYCGKS